MTGSSAQTARTTITSFRAPSSQEKGGGRRTNNVVNITIIDDYLDKRQVRARAPSDYMGAISQANASTTETMRSHLIDDLDKFGVLKDDYGLFLARRAAAISKQLKRRLIPRDIDAQGQDLREDDADEETTALA